MVYRLASELSDRIAAIAPVAAVMGTQKVSLTRIGDSFPRHRRPSCAVQRRKRQTG